MTLDARRVGLALDDLRDLPIQRFEHTPFLVRYWELRDNLTIYENIKSLPLDDVPLVGYVDLHLPLALNPAQSQLDNQRLLVYGFQQTRPQNPMNFDRRSDDLFSQRVSFFHLCELGVLCGY